MYSEKYFKYKQKYLELKKMVGGMVVNIDDNPDIIIFNKPFNEQSIDKVIEEVLNLAKNSTYLQDLAKDFSDERGFNLPWTSNWRDMLHDKQYFKYASDRDLRFRVSNGNVIALRFMNNLRSWNLNELNELDILISNALKKLNIS